MGERLNMVRQELTPMDTVSLQIHMKQFLLKKNPEVWLSDD